MTDYAWDPSKNPNPKFRPERVPDIMGVKEGWRAWKVSGRIPQFGADVKLYSVTTDYYWAPHKAIRASCESCDPADVPGQSCSCGMYSAKSRAHLYTMPYYKYDGEVDGMYCVVGKVANWGGVIEGSLGWRSEFSYPVEIFVPYEIARLAPLIAKSYGVRCRLDNILRKVA